MSKITAIRAGRSKRKRVNMFLDGQFAFSLEAEIVTKEGLEVGHELSASQIDALTRVDRFDHCFNAATHYLGYRPRSEAEIRERLHQRGFDDDNVAAVITKLKEQELVDDIAFAQFWKDSRESFRPRSQWLVRLELKQKGVAADIIDRVVSGINDDDSAYKAAVSKAHGLPRSDYKMFRRQLGEFLRRRGFSYGVISYNVRRIWQELGEQDR